MKKHLIMLLIFMLSNSIFSCDFEEFEVIFKKDVRSISEKHVRNIVEDALYDVLEADPYYKAISHVYCDENDVPDFFVTYLLRSDCLLYESYKINLDKNANILGIQKNFKNPYNGEDSKECYSCPDPEVEVYVSCPMDGTPLGAAEWCYAEALGAGYNVVKDIQGASKADRYKQYITCPNLKAVVFVGHGNNEKGILFGDVDITHEWFAQQANDLLEQQVHMYGSCLIQNDPFKAAILGTGVEAFMAGVEEINQTTLQNTMFFIARGIFYDQEVEAAFNSTDARSNGWGISGNPPNGPWYVERDNTNNTSVYKPELKTPELLCRYLKATQNIAVTYAVKQNPDVISQNVRLDVYSTGGRLLKNLVNEHKPVDTYKVNWNVSNQADGVYIFKLKIGNKNHSGSTVVFR